VKTFRANSVSMGKRKLFKILNDKNYIFNTAKSVHTLFFRASTSCSKILNDEKYIQHSETFQGTLCFSGQAQSCSKILWMIKIYSMQWNVSGQTLFSGQAQVSQKSWKIKNISIHWKIQGKTVFFRKAQSCSEVLKDKKYFNTVKKFRANSVFQGKRKLFKILN